MSTVKFDTWKSKDGTNEYYKCRAWVNFDGTTNTGGNCDIRASGNVSSITDLATGDYTVNFSTAMPDANYSVTGAHNGGNYSAPGSWNYSTPTMFSALATTSFRVSTWNAPPATSQAVDASQIFISVFR